MPNLRRPFPKVKANNVVGRVKPNGHCKKHPKHHQSPGVCSLCLREKLTQLSSSNSSLRIPTSSTIACSSTSSTTSSLSSYYSSCSSSSCASPMHGRFRFDSVSFFMMSGKQGIMKSRSMGFGPMRRRDHSEGDVDCVHDNSDNKSGFWFKLLHPKSKRMEKKDTKLMHYSMSITKTVTVAS